ncbi:hypothetical protein OIDMADRAFT_111112 [Oidiodendron maius Zn]|uniref:non-specific serine/threonine protein kinase n=1 Tax=Oidiodendron maius (strain Zn) TaxID=913774 RepID=A0A0C3I0K8_OIDMZ|nr:hypothetical protein OIDMADRAFT_111112 [Oidiodendron maius Zn]
MAAQLINNLSTASKPRQGGQDDLQALLELSNMVNRAEESLSPDLRLEHHHLLIYVFVRLVLEPLMSDDPFIDVQNVVSQASDALDAFISAIKETPSVLNCVPQPESLQNRGAEPLWLWLFPRLLGLLGRKRCDALTEKIKDLFFVSFHAVSRLPSLWYLASLFFCYLKEGAATPSFENEARQVACIHSSYTIQDPVAGLCHVTNILSMLVDICMESATSHHATPAFQDYLAWLLDSFLVCHGIEKRWQANPLFSESCEQSEVMALSSMQALLSALRISLPEAVLRKGCELLAILIVDLLENSSKILNKTVTYNVCSGLLTLAIVCKRHESTRRSKAGLYLCNACEASSLKVTGLDGPESFDSIQLNRDFHQLGLGDDEDQLANQPPPSKRRKLHSQSSLLDELVTNVCLLLGSEGEINLSNLDQTAGAGYENLSEGDRSRVMEYLGMIPCAANGSLVVNRDQAGAIHYSKCYLCESIQPPASLTIDDDGCQYSCHATASILRKLVNCTAFQSSRRPRVLGMIALKRLTVHFIDLDFWDLRVSVLGQWTLTSLHSSIREIRILGGVVQDQELNVVLLKLLDYLGHTNPIVSGVAFSELLKVAKKRSATIQRMFNPFWDTVAVNAVKDLLGRPQISQLMSDLLEMSVPDFLVLTQSYTLPWLVMHKKTDVIKRISQARKDDDGLKIRRALSLLAEYAPANDSIHKRTNVTAAFLEHHILGLVAHFSEVVNDARDEKQVREKITCIKAIDEMVKLGKTATRTARPHICACLQSAMMQKDLQEIAFSAWHTLLTNLDDEDVELMLESTFSIISQFWSGFGDVTRQRAMSALQYLLDQRILLVQNAIVNLPSLSHLSQLASIEEQLNKLRTPTDVENSFQIFCRRVGHENPGVVAQALVELKAYLQTHQSFLQSSAVSEQPDVVVGLLVRSVLDACVKFNESRHDISQLSAEVLGLIGCLDPNRVEAVREQREMVVVSNFIDPGETTDFVLFMLEEVIVKAFLSSTDTGVQGFLSYVMQVLLEKCDFREVCVPNLDNGQRSHNHPVWLKWKALPETIQDTLTPFLTSRYVVKELAEIKIEYPIFRPNSIRSDRLYNNWLKDFVMDLLQKPQNLHAQLIFSPLRRAIKIRDNSAASFLLPYLVLHVVLAGTDLDRELIGAELLLVLRHKVTADSHTRLEDLKMCIETVFRVLDYLSQWIRAKQSAVNQSRGQTSIDPEIQLVNSFLKLIPAETIAQRAVECKSYSRALFYWEQHIRNIREQTKDNDIINNLLSRLQDIYTQIDEPDGIEGLSAHLHVLDIDQQILGHQKAGRWTTAQSWYEIKLTEDPDNVDIQANLLSCLKKSGQHETDVLLNYAEGMHFPTTAAATRLLPFATEASWVTGRWPVLEKYTSMVPKGVAEDFNISIGRALLALHAKDKENFTSIIRGVRKQISLSLSTATTTSIGACHDVLFKCHVLTELEIIAAATNETIDRQAVLESLDKRLELLGAYLDDKQYLLGIRRAAMQLSSLEFTKGDIASAWLTSARLARKGNSIHQSFNAVIHASQLGDKSTTIEHARLLWKEGHHRKAIQSLQGAIANDAFISHNTSAHSKSYTGPPASQQNLLTARANLLLAKWLDSAGQTQSTELRSQYQRAASQYSSWEKGHYYLGRHYNKLLESEKALPPELQAEQYLTGEMAKLVIENYLRSLSYGTKYIYQTLPRILTLWLDLGSQVGQPLDAKYGNSKEFLQRIMNGRMDMLAQLHTRFTKYISKMPAYMFYTALPQIVARIAHPNAEVYNFLHQIIYKVVDAHPQQALWTLLATCTPSPLAVPIESVLTATLPTLTDTVRGHKAFSRDVVTISSFLDEVLILSSLQKPRKLTARGSDGKNYGLLCKPKDDLRKDQRLMEFNSMINRSLKRDAESSRRQLYIKTYAVTPLNEECGIIEWVDGLKTLRDILLGLYKPIGISLNLRELGVFFNDATKGKEREALFTEKVLKKFPPIFHLWFVQQFPEPSAWFAARLRYTRSCAVMSMVGTILGLGDRHGENILFEEGNGGTFHVDFNCLFDKGLTFATPEKVPFRLTHNMVDAMGIYGYEGPFRQSSELTLKLLRQHEETLMTIMEAFVYDPTLDLLAKKDKKPRREGSFIVPQTPQGVLNTIQRKLRGLLAGESVPLGVEGQVDELIKQATNLQSLAEMYIGWCSFL